MQNLRLRVMRDQDVPAVAELNRNAVPAVNDVGEEGIAHLRDLCDVQLVATEPSGRVIAFLLSMGTGQAYDSENYQYFEKEGFRHQYVDRIVVSPTAKGTGVGRALYQSVIERARERGLNEVTCEVNTEPPNPGSLAFHERLGFRQVGEQSVGEGPSRKTVALLALSVYDAQHLGS